MIERVLMRMEVFNQDTFSKVNNLFREKVQLEERLKEVESQIHFHRGVIGCMEKLREVSKEIDADQQLEETFVPSDNHEGMIPVEDMV